MIKIRTIVKSYNKVQFNMAGKFKTISHTEIISLKTSITQLVTKCQYQIDWSALKIIKEVRFPSSLGKKCLPVDILTVALIKQKFAISCESMSSELARIEKLYQDNKEEFDNVIIDVSSPIDAKSFLSPPPVVPRDVHKSKLIELKTPVLTPDIQQTQSTQTKSKTVPVVHTKILAYRYPSTDKDHNNMSVFSINRLDPDLQNLYKDHILGCFKDNKRKLQAQLRTNESASFWNALFVNVSEFNLFDDHNHYVAFLSEFSYFIGAYEEGFTLRQEMNAKRSENLDIIRYLESHSSKMDILIKLLENAKSNTGLNIAHIVKSGFENQEAHIQKIETAVQSILQSNIPQSPFLSHSLGITAPSTPSSLAPTGVTLYASGYPPNDAITTLSSGLASGLMPSQSSVGSSGVSGLAPFSL